MIEKPEPFLDFEQPSLCNHCWSEVTKVPTESRREDMWGLKTTPTGWIAEQSCKKCGLYRAVKVIV